MFRQEGIQTMHPLADALYHLSKSTVRSQREIRIRAMDYLILPMIRNPVENPGRSARS